MQVYDPFPVARQGEIMLSDEPGWGVEVSSSALERMPRQISLI